MELQSDICRKCENKFKDSEEKVVCLGPCHKQFHAKCFGFTPTALKFYKECKNISFECDDCQDDPPKMINRTLDKILSFMNIFNERLNRQENKSEIISKQIVELNSNVQKSEIEIKAELNKGNVEGRNQSHISFAEIVKKPVNDPVVIVRPKKQQKCADTRADVNKKIMPIKIALSSVNNKPDGGIEIKCKNNEDVTELHEKAMKEMADDYTVAIRKIRNPKVRVTNMSQKLSGDEIIKSLKRNNEFLKGAEMKVLHTYDIKINESYGAIMEVEPKTFNQLMKVGDVVIEMNKCDVTECLNVLRCYKCCGYNHKSNVCKNRKACLRCGDEHEIKDCGSKHSACINCKVISDKLKLKLDINHPAFSHTCSVFKRQCERSKRFTRYE